MISSPLKLTVDEQEDVQLTCRGKAGLFTNLTWVKDGVFPLTNSTDVIVKNTGTLLQDKVSQLLLKNVTSSQTGNYSCYGQPTRAEDSIVVTHSEVQINGKFYFTLSHQRLPTVYILDMAMHRKVEKKKSLQFAQFGDRINKCRNHMYMNIVDNMEFLTVLHTKTIDFVHELDFHMLFTWLLHDFYFFSGSCKIFEAQL